jgi:light-regulated signal transduction histidine kinase (bacteriophytochrome)
MEYIIQNTKKMNNLLSGLLEYSTVSYQEASVEEVNIGEVVQAVVHQFGQTITAKKARIIYSQTLPSIHINRLHLFQLLENTISNALKFCIENPVVQLKVEESPENVIISIKDNGIGMDEAYKDKVFKLFQQLHKNDQSQNTETGIGVGVGLSICKNIVEKYQGDIWFKSQLGKGTTFYISLPC